MADDFMTGFIAGQADNDKNVCVVPTNNGGWGGNGSWGEMIFAIIILAMFAGGDGFGNGGLFGNRGGGASGEIQRGFDTSAITNKLDGINSGLCDGFYAMNTGMLNGFNGVQRDLCTGLASINAGISENRFATQQGFTSTQMAMMQGQNALQSQLAQCCCDNRAAIADLKYDMATSDCSIKTLVNQLAQQIMWGQQNGIRDLSDLINNKFCQLEMSQKDAVIADLRNQLSQCGDQNMANAIVARLTSVINPPAVPAYPAANPNGCGSWPASFLTCNGNSWNGCGCNQVCGSCC